MSGAAEVIEGVESCGWTLAEMAYDGGQSKNGAMVFLFRRPAPAAARLAALSGYEQSPYAERGPRY